jgi:LPPG:FO 2-phospho-L-lactate transferase
VSIDVKVTVLVGGVGGARFLLGVQQYLGLGQFAGTATGPSGEHDLTAIVNVGDDAWMHGVRICPDLDTCMYTLGGGIDPERGWGHANETWHAKEELAAYGVQPDWFGLGDRDLATHLVRSQMLRAGYPLSQVTEALCARWMPGALLIPATDDRSETHVVVTDPDTERRAGAERPGDVEAEAGSRRAIHFQEWWVRYRAQIPTHDFAFVGADKATAAPGVLEAIAEADVVFLAPSNPVVSVGAILAVPGIRGALRSTAIGVQTSSQAVGAHFGARSGTGLLDGWLVDDGDTATVDGVAVRSVPLLMTDPKATAEMVRHGIELAGLETSS